MIRTTQTLILQNHKRESEIRCLSYLYIHSGLNMSIFQKSWQDREVVSVANTGVQFVYHLTRIMYCVWMGAAVLLHCIVFHYCNVFPCVIFFEHLLYSRTGQKLGKVLEYQWLLGLFWQQNYNFTDSKMKSIV